MTSQDITDKSLTPELVASLREKFIQEYAKSKGWDRNNLTTEQLLEITSMKQYKVPTMILS